MPCLRRTLRERAQSSHKETALGSEKCSLANIKEGKSAINRSNLGKFLAKFGPRPFIYVRPVGGPENYLC